MVLLRKTILMFVVLFITLCVSSAIGAEDQTCLNCHGERRLFSERGGKKVSLYVHGKEFANSVHGKSGCVSCHEDADVKDLPHKERLAKVNCATCHDSTVKLFEKSLHGEALRKHKYMAPDCTTCHGKHGILASANKRSRTFVMNIPFLCGSCHKEGTPVSRLETVAERHVLEDYSESIHGDGLFRRGLIVTAVCTSCHSSHNILPHENPLSSINSKNIPKTCMKCHLGIFEQLKKSVHSSQITRTDKKLPVCSDCHLSHTIKRVDLDDFRQDILSQCGRCHAEVAESYFDTFHGKVSKLGSARTAKCYDCHGAHNVLPPSDPDSTLSRKNVVSTCKSCHPKSNRKFVGYLTHATHHDKHKYPFLYYTFWFMTFILLGTFSFFGIHTILSFPKAFMESRKRAKNRISEQLHPSVEGSYYRRFDIFSRVLHFFVIISFLLLAVTGMTIKFSGVGVFQTLSKAFGGWEVTGFIHRVAAVIISVCFCLHFGQLIFIIKKKKMTIKELLTGENTLMPRKEDLVEFVQNCKWFLGIGPRPQFGRWTYWEKFDYLAVSWGMLVIGFSGLLLWFPEFFTHILDLPGWLINVATIIHSIEALLAAGFIFTIHFFNTHFRPEVFPMDSVIFTGSMPLEALKEDRPREYSNELKNRTIRKKMAKAPPRWIEIGARIFGLSALGIGISITILIIYSMIFLYR